MSKMSKYRQVIEYFKPKHHNISFYTHMCLLFKFIGLYGSHFALRAGWGRALIFARTTSTL